MINFLNPRLCVSACLRLKVCIKRPIMFFLIMLLVNPVWSSSNIREAEAYFETKNDEKAIEFYEKVAKDPNLLPWQQAAVQYNIGVSLIKAGKWEEAIKAFQQIRTGSPLILRNMNASSAFIHLHLAQIDGEQDEKKTLDSLNDALREVDEAIKADCLLQKVEGNPTCIPSEELVALRHSIEKERSLYTDLGLGTNDPIETRIYMEAAAQWMNRAIRNTRADDPMGTLKNAVEDQEHALSINRLAKQLPSISEDIQKLVLLSQKETLKTADPFYARVLEKQKKNYPDQCQCHPWDKVIPSFEEGYKRAKWNLPIISIQEDILRYWKQTQENVTKQEETPAEPKETSEKIQDVLRELQGMDQDDQLPKQKKQVLQEGIRPW